MERKSDQSNALGWVMVPLLVPFGAHLCSPTATSCCLFSFCLLLMFVSPQAQLTESWSPVFSLSFLSHLRVRPHSHMPHPSWLFYKSPNMSKHGTISEQLSLLLIPTTFFLPSLKGLFFSPRLTYSASQVLSRSCSSLAYRTDVDVPS